MPQASTPLCSWFANLDIDSNSYHGETLYGLGLLASRCWFVWALLRARQLHSQTDHRKTRPDTSDAKYTPLLAMVVVGVILLIGSRGVVSVRTCAGISPQWRMIVVLVFAFFFAMSIVIKEYLDNRELIGEVEVH